jgi:hypothetical protein
MVGGKGANHAVVAARLGAQPRLIGSPLSPGSSMAESLRFATIAAKPLICRRSACCPRIDDFDSASLEIAYVARRQSCAPRPDNRCDLRIDLADGLTASTPPGCDVWIHKRRIGVERQDTARHILLEDGHGCGEQIFPAPAFRQKRQAIKNLGLGQCRRKQPRKRLFRQPSDHAFVWSRPHHLRDDVGVEDDHALKSNGSRIISR